MRIEIGQLLKVNYTPGTMRVVSLIRGCTCAHVLDDMNARKHLGEEASPLPPHMHLYLRHTDDGPEHLRGSEAWLGYYDETTLRSYNAGGKLGRDRIILVENLQPVQATFAI